MTQIQLEGFGFIDAQDGTSFPLNFNIQNLLDSTSTPSSYSKNITIVGTKETNKILGQAFDVNISNSSFNVNKRVKCNVIQSGVNVFNEAYFQLISVDKTGKTQPNGEDEIMYTGRIKSNLTSFFSDIKTKELRDLRLGRPEDFHLLSTTAVTDRIDNTAVDRWKYITHFNSGTVFNISDFKPAIYAKTYWDAIHEQNGWEYDFPEISDLRFDKLLIPSTEKYEANDELKDQESFKAQRASRTIDGGFTTGITDLNTHRFFNNYTIPLGDITQNPNNQWNIIQQRFTPNFVGNYTVDVNFDFQLTISPATQAYLQCSGGAESLVVDFYFEYTINGGGSPFGTGTWVQSNTIRHVFYKDQIIGSLVGPSTATLQSGNITLTASLNLNQGDQITAIRVVHENNPGDANGSPIPRANNVRARFIRTPIGNTNPGIQYNPKLLMSNIKFGIRPELEYNYGTPIYVDHYIPSGIKQRDFIKSIIDMYKLIVDIDPTQENRLIYKTRDKYYDEGRQINWTKKLAKDRKITVEWIQDKQSKDLILTYKPDEDALNNGYSNVTKQTYGQYRYTFENEYNIGETKQELVFSPTPIYRDPFSNMFLPGITSEPEKNYNIRLLYDNGRRTDGYFYIVLPDGSLSALESDYPMATHLDDPVNPSFDLNFDRCAYYFYNDWDPMTLNNLFNLFHRRYISQLTKGRIMTAFFRLTPLDILNFRLNDRIFINDTWWNVNKIVDYNANSEQLTKVELVTVDDGLSIRTKPTIGTVRPVLPANPIGPIKPNPTDPIVVGPIRDITREIRNIKNTFTVGSAGTVIGTGNVVNSRFGPFDGLIIGDNNTVSGTKSLIIGDNNNDGGNTTKLIVGDNITSDGKADIVAGTIEAKSDIRVGGLDLSEDGIVRIEQYMEDGYTDPNEYTERSELNITFGDDGITTDKLYVRNQLVGVNEYIFEGYTDDGYIVRTENTIEFNEDGITIDAETTTIDSELYLEQIVVDETIKEGLVIDPITKQVFKRNLIPAFINYFDFDSASVTNVVASNTWYKLNTNTASLFSENGLIHTNNRITNTTHNKIIQGHGVLSIESGNGNEIHVAFFRGTGTGTPTIIPCSEQSVVIGANNKASAIPFQCMFTLDTDEWVEVWVKNASATTNITLANINVIANEKLTS